MWLWILYFHVNKSPDAFDELIERVMEDDETTDLLGRLSGLHQVEIICVHTEFPTGSGNCSFRGEVVSLLFHVAEKVSRLLSDYSRNDNFDNLMRVINHEFVIRYFLFVLLGKDDVVFLGKLMRETCT